MDSARKFLSLVNQSWRYQPLPHTGHHDGHEEAKPVPEVVRRHRRCWQALLLFLVIALIALALVKTREPPDSKKQDTSSACYNPVQRQEWRALQPWEQHEYIAAVLCLSAQPSVFEQGSSRYDDFVYAHVFEGANTAHHSASFLPWHRFFIHAFETALRNECGFRGSLTYWDWTLDADDLADSPVWDTITGFGGDGDLQFPEPELFDGRCVADGPFAHAKRHWQSKANGHGFDILRNPHCLSRGFAPTERKEVFGSRIGPNAITRLLKQPTYDELIEMLEVKAHNTVPLFVHGDFFGLSAPNVWYLHHTQVDRLWWLWQQDGEGEDRQLQYHGAGENTRIYKNMTHSESSLEDVLSYGPFAEAVQVKDVMSTQTSILCYRY